MKIIFMLSASFMLFSGAALAEDLLCTGGGESLTITIGQDKIGVSKGYGELARETQDPDCVYRSKHFACYEAGQLMINIPLTLLDGTKRRGTVFIQSDTGDNADSHNHALLGVGYACILK